MAVQGWETDYISAQTDPVPDYLAFQRIRNPHLVADPKTIYGKLDKDFTIMKALVDKTQYRFLLNDPLARITFFAVPDSLIPGYLKESFLKLDYGDATAIIQCHISEEVRIVPQLISEDFLLPTKHPIVRLQTKKGRRAFHPFGINSQQMIAILNDGNMFVNGMVVVIGQPIIPLT